MWLYSRPSCPDHSFSEEWRNAEINTQILNVLDRGANLFESILAACVISFSHHACDLAQGLGGAYNAPWGTRMPEDVAQWAVNRALNEVMWAPKEKENVQSVAHRAAEEQGKTPPLNLIPQRRRRGR
jgi:hypothetical protein